MHTFTHTTMNKLSPIVFAVIGTFFVLALAGCDMSPDKPYNPFNQGPPPGYDPAVDQKTRFEAMRKRTRNNLAEDAKNNPDKFTYVTMSLWDYYPIITLVDFEKKYPSLKVIFTEVMVKGSTTPTELNPDLPLTQELDAVIKKQTLYYEGELQKIKSAPNVFTDPRDLIGAQAVVDAIKAGNVRTFGFGIQGRLKDIEAMAQQEYGEQGQGKMIRVIMQIGRISTGELPFSDYEPIYANDDKTLDPGK